MGPEEDEEVDLVLGDSGAYLQVASEWSALESGDFAVEFFLQEFACGACCVEVVFEEGVSVIPCPFEEVWFFVVVCDEGDSFSVLHYGCFCWHFLRLLSVFTF